MVLEPVYEQKFLPFPLEFAGQPVEQPAVALYVLHPGLDIEFKALEHRAQLGRDVAALAGTELAPRPVEQFELPGAVPCPLHRRCAMCRRSSTPAGVLVMDKPSPVVSLRATTGYKL